MYVKIKLEPQSLKALPLLKKISYFSIDDDATIINLKMKIEEYLDVPAERQEIRALGENFENRLYVKEVCSARGSAIMLYAYDESNEDAEPQFVCFLQVYTNELAAQQQELEQRSKLTIEKTKITTPTSSTSSVILIDGYDTDRDSEETDTETSSSKTTSSDLDSSSGTDNSNSSCLRKRSKQEKKYALQNKKLKVTATSESQYSETLCQYLDEFPKCPKQISCTKDNVPDNETQALYESKCGNKDTNDFTNCKTSEIEKRKENGNKLLGNTKLEGSPCKSSQIEKPKTNENKPFEDMNPQTATIQNSSKIQSNVITTTINKNSNNNIHPCYSISPEIRDFLAIISRNDVNPISNIECEELLVWFFDRFRACDSSKNLQFDNKTAISLFEGKLWIACMNMNTFEWISENIIKYSPKSYKILTLKESKHSCEVVVPVVSNSKNVLDIFDLLEKQNQNITTLKWSLQSRQLLLANDKKFNEQAVSTFCTNELFNIAMDVESKTYLEKLNFKLKYCFWQIVFKFK